MNAEGPACWLRNLAEVLPRLLVPIIRNKLRLCVRAAVGIEPFLERSHPSLPLSFSDSFPPIQVDDFARPIFDRAPNFLPSHCNGCSQGWLSPIRLLSLTAFPFATLPSLTRAYWAFCELVLPQPVVVSRSLEVAPSTSFRRWRPSASSRQRSKGQRLKTKQVCKPLQSSLCPPIPFRVPLSSLPPPNPDTEHVLFRPGGAERGGQNQGGREGERRVYGEE
jgi:hypothetical protein